jgi:hypothetical protein
MRDQPDGFSSFVAISQWVGRLGPAHGGRGNARRPQAVRAFQPGRARKCVALYFSLLRFRFASQPAPGLRNPPRNRARRRRPAPPRRPAWRTSGGASLIRPSAHRARRRAPVTPRPQAWPGAAVVPRHREIRPRRHPRSAQARAPHPALRMIRAGLAPRRASREEGSSSFLKKRTKKLLPSGWFFGDNEVVPHSGRQAPQPFFLSAGRLNIIFFFSKKNYFLPYFASASINACPFGLPSPVTISYPGSAK